MTTQIKQHSNTKKRGSMSRKKRRLPYLLFGMAFVVTARQVFRKRPKKPALPRDATIDVQNILGSS